MRKVVREMDDFDRVIITVDPINAIPEQYGDYVECSDRLVLQGIDNNILEATNLLGNLGGETFDNVIRNPLVNGTNVIFQGSKLATNELDNTSKITVASVLKAARDLKRRFNKPFSDGYFVCIVHPDVSYDLQRDPDWIEANKAGMSQAIYKGELGAIGKVRFVESSNAYIETAAGASTNLAEIKATDDGGTDKADVYYSIVLAPDAYGCVGQEGQSAPEIYIKQLGSGGTADPLDQRATVGFKGMQTSVILDQSRMLRIESVASA